MAAYGERRALPALGAAAAALLPSGTPSAKFDLTLSVEATPDGTFDAAFIYALDLFEADAIARLAARFVTLLTDALARPDMPIGDLDWLPADERAQLFAWNAPAGATESEPFVPVHARIAAHAQARPDARGVADIDRALTRGESTRARHAWRAIWSRPASARKCASASRCSARSTCSSR